MVLEAEWRISIEAHNLIKRRPDRLVTVIGLYATSLIGYQRGLLLRKAYMPVRYIDDLLDGDVDYEGDPLQFTENLKEQIVTDNFDEGSNVSMLLQSALVELEAKSWSSDDFRGDFLRAIQAIEFDNHRSKTRNVLNSSELENYYHNAFDPVMNISCGAIDSSVRAVDIPIMSIGQGVVQSYRDRELDWSRGIINIPREVLMAASMTSRHQFKEVDANQLVKDWWNVQLTEVKDRFNQLLPNLKELPEPRTHLFCKALVKPLLNKIDRVG